MMPLLLVSACAEEQIQARFSDDYRCHEDQVEVEALGGQRYRATGCGRSATYQCLRDGVRDNVCAKESEPEPEPDASASVATRKLEAPPARRQNSIISLDLKLDQRTTLKLRAAPAKQGELLQLGLARTEPRDTLEDCDFAWLADGRVGVSPTPVFARTSNMQSSLRLDLNGTAARQLRRARQFALKVCDYKWSLDEEQLSRVHEFVRLYDEELAWSGGAKQANDALLPPQGGWPGWTASAPPPVAIKTAKPLEGQELYKKLAPSVYQLEVQGESGLAQGSGVAVSTSELATNCHVLTGARRIIIRQHGQESIGRILRSQPAADRCVLGADQPFNPVQGVRSYSDLAVGEATFTLGSPHGLELSLANGILSGLRQVHDTRYVQTTAPISPGSSGGGLFDAFGNLIGITTGMLVGEEHLNQSLNFAIAADSFFKKEP
ncbi:MAG TPA: serine protease [Polyangiaceae bacterium]|nr:serine protease [Polyangiaceae bacterium]